MGACTRGLVLVFGLATACCYSPEPNPAPYADLGRRIVIPLEDGVVWPSTAALVPEGMECRIEGEPDQRVLICEESPLVEEDYIR